MAGLSIDIILFAPLASIFGVILFWFIQLIFVEGQKFLLSKIRDKHEPLCRFTNFLGIFFQMLCHAMGYTITKSGISNFYISVNYGKVTPKKEKKGIFEWLSNVFLFLGPFFIPSFFLITLFLLLNGNINIIIPSEIFSIKYTFAGQMITFGNNIFTFSKNLLNFIFNIDLFHPGHFGFLLLIIFLGMGIRPSYIGKEKSEKVNMIYDLVNIKNNILRKPLYILILLLIIYIFFYISYLLGKDWYVILFSVIGWLSIIAIISLIVTHMILIMIRTTDKLPKSVSFIPYLILPLSYILVRLIFIFYLKEFQYIANSTSLLIMILSTILSILFLLKYTNKFKPSIQMKLLKNSKEGNTDGSKRVIRK